MSPYLLKILRANLMAPADEDCSLRAVVSLNGYSVRARRIGYGVGCGRWVQVSA
jgi:hypothetical protein